MLVNTENQRNDSASCRLQKLLQKADAPTLPVIAQKLIELCSNDQANFRDFARVLEADPGLASRILRVANSAYYGLRIKATSLERAITALGLKYVKSISLGFHLAATLNTLDSEDFNMTEFWRQSVLRAVIARQLAAICIPQKREEAFLIGLLQNCGIPFLADALGKPYSQIWNQSRNSHTALLKLERKVFEIDHIMAAQVIVKQWALPQLLAEPILSHHRPSQAQPSFDQMVQLSQIAYFTGTLSLHRPDSITQEDQLLPEYARSAFGLDPTALQVMLEQARQEFLGVAQLFADILPQQCDIVSLLEHANDLLCRENWNERYQTFDLNTEFEELLNLPDPSDETCVGAGDRVDTDELTGLKTRDTVLQYINSACSTVQTAQTTMAVLYIDIVRLNDLNERWGWPAGNQALSELARLLKEIFANSGYLARVDQDDVVVVLLGPSSNKANTLAKAIARKIHNLKITMLPQNEDISFACRLGLLFCEAGSHPGSAVRVLELAHNQMTLAKHTDPNSLCCQFLYEQPKSS